MSSDTLILSVVSPVILPQTTVCMANMHRLPSVGTPVQAALVFVVSVGQLPQLDVRIL